MAIKHLTFSYNAIENKTLGAFMMAARFFELDKKSQNAQFYSNQLPNKMHENFFSLFVVLSLTPGCFTKLQS